MSQSDRQIVWSPLSEQDVAQQLKYLEQHWGKQACVEYLDRIDEVLAAISYNPTTYYQVDAQRHIHKFFVNKRIVLYYQVTARTIGLIAFWDGRKNEESLAGRL
jgi:plasmid stabilization system protein ParE